VKDTPWIAGYPKRQMDGYWKRTSFSVTELLRILVDNQALPNCSCPTTNIRVIGCRNWKAGSLRPSSDQPDSGSNFGVSSRELLFPTPLAHASFRMPPANRGSGMGLFGFFRLVFSHESLPLPRNAVPGGRVCECGIRRSQTRPNSPNPRIQ